MPLRARPGARDGDPAAGHVGIEFSETCIGPAGTFENLHLADAGSGFVWRSLQWTGPQMDLIDLQVLEPLD